MTGGFFLEHSSTEYRNVNLLQYHAALILAYETLNTRPYGQAVRTLTIKPVCCEDAMAWDKTWPAESVLICSQRAYRHPY